MLRRKILSLTAAVMMVIATMLVAPATVAAASSGYNSPCYNWKGWTTGSENSFTMSSDLVSGFRAGRHSTCDRLVFALDGNDRVGYYAGYGKVVQPSGARVHVAGPVDFQVVVRAWPKGWDTATLKDDFAVQANKVVYSTSNPKGLKRVEQVKTGGAFEGETVFAVGLDKRVQWRLFELVLADGTRVVIVEFAHSRQ